MTRSMNINVYKHLGVTIISPISKSEQHARTPEHRRRKG